MKKVLLGKFNPSDLIVRGVRDGTRTGVIDLAPHADHQPDALNALKVGRLYKLEALDLADQVDLWPPTLDHDFRLGERVEYLAIKRQRLKRPALSHSFSVSK